MRCPFCDLIPRYRGDVEDPRGGVRRVIPGKGNYLMARSRAFAAVLASVCVSAALMALLVRAFSRYGAPLQPADLAGAALRDFGALDWSMLIATLLACVAGLRWALRERPPPWGRRARVSASPLVHVTGSG